VTDLRVTRRELLKLFGGYRGVRLIHFLAMSGMLAFVPGHLLMVALHGRDNFASMLTGWKEHPEYIPREPGR
jgi:thiosulfate reductase cytochrome b subunit